MSRIRFAIAVFLIPLLLGGCKFEMPTLGLTDSTVGFGSRGDESYQQHLIAEYRALADFEETVLGDAEDATHFRNKAIKASTGFSVGPDEINPALIPSESLAALREARATLVDALSVMKTQENEPFLALAQSKYDCWLSLQADYPEYTNNFVCQQHFYTAMKFLKAPPQLETGGYVVFFDSASTSLDDDSMRALKEAVLEYKHHPGWTVLLNGYTDSKGDRASNEVLARRRAIAVKNMLGQQGVDIDNIEISAIGESKSDGSEEEDRNSRRVEIKIVPHYGDGGSS